MAGKVIELFHGKFPSYQCLNRRVYSADFWANLLFLWHGTVELRPTIYNDMQILAETATNCTPIVHLLAGWNLMRSHGATN